MQLKKIQTNKKRKCTYKLNFIYSTRIMVTSLSNLFNNFQEKIRKTKCKDCHFFLEYKSANGNAIKCKCLSCNKNYSTKIDEELKKRFKNAFYGFNPYQYIDECEKINQRSLPEKEEFYSSINLEYITDADCIHAKIFSKDWNKIN